MKNITFEDNGFIFKATSFDNKTMVLHCDQFDNQNNFIKKRKLTFAELPKNIKKKLNPLK